MSKTKIFVGAFALAFAFAAASASAAYMHTVTLKQGSTGSQVMSLQQTLNMTTCKVAASGAGSPGMETSSFGSKTKAAVQCFQSMNGLTADGVVGPMTGAKLAAVSGGSSMGGGSTPAPCPVGYVCTPSGGSTGGSTSSLSGADGTPSDVSKISSYNNEEVGESQNDVKVLGFEVKASKDGDIALKSVKLTLTYNGSGSNRLNRYIDGVTVWQGDSEIGSTSVDDFNKDSSGTYSKTISLSNSVVRANKTEKFYVSFDANDSLDTTDINSNPDWYITLNNIRYEDGSGVVSTDSDTGDLGGSLNNVGINFVDFASASDTEFKLSEASDNPDAGIVVIDTSDDTNGVVLLKGKVKIEGDSDVTINEFPVTLGTTGDGIASIASNLTLVLDGEEFDESPVATNAESATVVFDNLDFDVSAGDTINFEVRADINGSSGNFTEGDKITASVTGDNRSAIDVENEQGDQLADSIKSGTVGGKDQELRSTGVSLALVSTNATATVGQNANDDTGTFTIKFKVTAVGDDVYVGTVATADTTYTVDISGTATIGGVSGVMVNNTDTTLSSHYNWLIPEGQSETITLTVQRAPYASTAGLFRAALAAIKWNTTDSSTVYNTYSSNLDEFKTDYLSLN